MTAEILKKGIYNLAPDEAKEIYNYTSNLIKARTHDERIRTNNIFVKEYTELINHIEDELCVKIISQSRKQYVAFCRYCLYKYLQEVLQEQHDAPDKSFVVVIADVFKKDHSSIIHGLNTYNDEIGINTELQYYNTQIRSIIKSYKDSEFIVKTSKLMLHN